MAYQKCLTMGMLGLGLLISMPAMGGEFRVIPMIAVKEEYNDNLFFDADDITRDFITTISPGLKLENNSERLNAGLIARIDQRLYADTDDLNATDQFYQGNLRYKLSPRLGIGAKAGFIQNSSPDRDIQTTGFVQTNATRNRQEYGVSGDYAITEKTTAGLGYAYSTDKYSGTRDAERDDVETNAGNLLLTHNLSTYFPETLGRLNFGYADYRFFDSTTQKYSATVGFSRRFSELWTVLVDVGARYTPTRFDAGPSQTGDSSGYGGVGNVVISYNGEKTGINFSLNHDIQPASGQEGASERTGLGISMNRRFAYEFSGFLNCGYFLNQSDPNQYSREKIDQQTVYINPGIRYEITQDMSVEASYNYARVEYVGGDNSTADRNLVMVRFYLQYPILE
jgi:hypothetical protein